MEKILIMGDLHGNWKHVRDLYQRHPYIFNNQKNTLILLGDAGLNFFFNHRDQETKKKLGKYPFTYFVVRGNHEERPSICAEKNPDKWHEESFWGGEVWVENDYPYIKYAMDYLSIYDIPYNTDWVTNPEKGCEVQVPLTYRTLVIPGAYSVDKYRRLQMGWSWFPHEQLSTPEMLSGKELLDFNNWKVDLVLSHTCPIIYEPTDFFLSVVNQSTVDKSMERYLGEIEYKLDYRAWLWGHYHQFRDYPRTDGRYRTMLFNDAAIDLREYMEGEVNKL